jgi:hypothetical protein
MFGEDRFYSGYVRAKLGTGAKLVKGKVRLG